MHPRVEPDERYAGPRGRRYSEVATQETVVIVDGVNISVAKSWISNGSKAKT